MLNFLIVSALHCGVAVTTGWVELVTITVLIEVAVTVGV